MVFKRTGNWYWGFVVHITLPRKKWSSPNISKALGQVWRALLIVNARTGEAALNKLVKIGKRMEGDSGGTLKLNNKPAVTKFLGLENIGVIHDGLTDGAELLWELKRCSLNKAKSMVQSRSDLLRAIKFDMEFKKGGTITKNGLKQAKKFVKDELRRAKQKSKRQSSHRKLKKAGAPL
jgi:hypothetical protein